MQVFNGREVEGLRCSDEQYARFQKKGYLVIYSEVCQEFILITDGKGPAKDYPLTYRDIPVAAFAVQQYPTLAKMSADALRQTVQANRVSRWTSAGKKPGLDALYDDELPPPPPIPKRRWPEMAGLTGDALVHTVLEVFDGRLITNEPEFS